MCLKFASVDWCELIFLKLNAGEAAGNSHTLKWEIFWDVKRNSSKRGLATLWLAF